MELTYSDRWQTQQVDGLRFVNVNIPANAKVLSARLVFTALNRTSGQGTLGTGDGNAVSIDIYGQADVNPAAFADAQDGSGLEGDISNRTKTSAMATWAIPNDAGGGTWVGDTQYATDTYDSAVGTDLGAVVEEIVGTAGWSQSSNAMVFVLQDANPSSTSGFRYAYTWDNDPTKAAQLEITYH
jgi:hypothetical protein